MIQINLLPEELRRNTHTSPKALALLFIASVISFGSAGVTGFLWFNMKADREARVQIAQDQLDSLMPRAKYADSLSKEKAEFDKRNNTITEIASSRIVWTKKLDRLSEVVNRDVTLARHKIWLQSVDVDSPLDTKAGVVKVEGFGVGKNLDNPTNFYDDLKTDPVFNAGLAEFTAPTQKVDDKEIGVIPPEKTEFGFSAKMPAKDIKAKKHTAAPKSAAPAPGK